MCYCNDIFDCPTEAIWYERRKWYEKEIEVYQGYGSYFVSEQACALSFDLQISFCAGAWITVVILSLAIIDAHLREIELPGFTGNTNRLILASGLKDDLDWLRIRRNKLIHINNESPEITVDDQWFERTKFEEDARKAITLVFKIMFEAVKYFM